MLARLAPAFLLGTLVSCWSAAVFAQAPGEPPPVAAEGEGEGMPAVRREVVVGVTGPLEPEARATLFRLLRAELEPHDFALVESDPRGDTRSWAREVLVGEARLLVVLLDTSPTTDWRLVVIDAARGRAISRELPGGARNAANVEAIVSIVLSATNALHEGLEVASAPIDAVVGGAPRESAPPPPKPAKAKAPEPESASGTSLHASLSASIASFSEAVEPTFGGSVALGASVASLVDVDLGGSLHTARRVESAFGSFTLERASLSISAGPVLRHGAFSLVPALGATAEWIIRAETRAASGVAPGDEAGAISRFGGELAIRGRYVLIAVRGKERLSMLGTLGAAYFGNEVRFLAGDEVVASARRAVFGAGLGVFIATDPL